MIFKAGETIILSCEVRDNSNALADPSTSMKITVNDNHNSPEVANEDMVKDDTGKYHYDYTPASTAPQGTYIAIFIATDGARVTKSSITFGVEY